MPLLAVAHGQATLGQPACTPVFIMAVPITEAPIVVEPMFIPDGVSELRLLVPRPLVRRRSVRQSVARTTTAPNADILPTHLVIRNEAAEAAIIRLFKSAPKKRPPTQAAF